MALPPTVPPLAALDLFVSVVDTGSVSRAAAIHGISQPSGSARISRLERQLGLALLQRTAGGSVPTEAGRTLALWARPVLDAATRFDAAVGALRVESGERLRLAASYTVAEYLLPTWLSSLAQRLAGTAVEVDVENSTVVTSRVLSGAADLGFVEGPTVDGALECRTVCRDELVLVAHPGHPWAQRREPLEPSHLAAARLVVRERGSGTRDVLEQALAALTSAPPPPLLELGSTTAVKSAVLDGAGCAVISCLAVRRELETAQLQRIPVRGLRLGRTLRAVWPAGTRPPETARMLIQHAVAAQSGTAGHDLMTVPDATATTGVARTASAGSGHSRVR